MSDITKEQFEQGYAKLSGVTVEWLREQGQKARPCECGDSSCQGWQIQGWQMAHGRNVTDPACLTPEWRPTKKDYLRIEREVVALMLAQRKHEKRLVAMAVLWMITAIFALLHLVLT